ncbi:SGNH/GDSL hydrolase family protein [Bradyrhizobium cenepequi]|uniref:SGNH/GDSL hydrolase family protein n=1 Tax=Bradyrhizobium cenepequi TaxID=2821403 RepID=UPI001CE278B8|nr:SGNH/GDSL hydrolase family protein [Bradyrhizobium cenepequi]MCA6106965.1 SGNH/GDSL hydrolase family protein [Bradyrhizobium cenepequi]
MNRREVLLSLGVAAAGAVGTYFTTRAHWRGTYLQMGTSITAGVTPKAGRTPALVGDQLGMVGINGGIAGAWVGHHTVAGRDHRSLFAVVDAVISGDWSRQEAETDPTIKTNISHLATADFSKLSLLGLEYGPNDYAYDCPIGEASDTDCRTFSGALSYSLSKLWAAFPKLRMFLITPAWRLNPKGLDSDTNPNGIGLFLKDYVDAMIQIAERHHIPCLDMWRTFGINIHNYKALTFDGTHPNDECAVRRADVIASFVKATF